MPCRRHHKIFHRFSSPFCAEKKFIRYQPVPSGTRRYTRPGLGRPRAPTRRSPSILTPRATRPVPVLKCQRAHLCANAQKLQTSLGHSSRPSTNTRNSTPNPHFVKSYINVFCPFASGSTELAEVFASTCLAEARRRRVRDSPHSKSPLCSMRSLRLILLPRSRISRLHAFLSRRSPAKADALISRRMFPAKDHAPATPPESA
jgi:hypothetical protein